MSVPKQIDLIVADLQTWNCGRPRIDVYKAIAGAILAIPFRLLQPGRLSIGRDTEGGKLKRNPRWALQG